MTGGALRDGVKSGECAGGECRGLVWHLCWELGLGLLWNPVWAIVWGGLGGSGFFDDFWRGSGVWAFGEFFCGEEFGVAVVAVARAEEVEEALLGDGDVSGSG
jgi:hypothetical protein